MTKHPHYALPRLQRAAAQLLNIAPHEWERVGFSWGMKLCFAFGHAIGHTVFLALFATRYGIGMLPVFFVGTALLAIVSTIVMTPLLERVRKEFLLAGASGLGAIALVAAYAWDAASPLATAGLGLFATGAVMTQVGIILALFIEEQYTPLESQRTFPIIESAEVVGLLGGGVLVYVLIGRIHAPDLLLLWGIALAALCTLVMVRALRRRRVPELAIAHGHRHVPGLVDTVRRGFGSLNRVQFLRRMAWAMFVLGAVGKLIEYQYTAALAGAAHHAAASGAHAEEEHLAHALSLYIVVFSLATLGMQLFVSSRVLRRLGVTRTMILHPMLSLVAFSAMALRFAPATAVVSRFTYDVTRGLFLDAYLSSYYTVSHRIRERAKAIIEGWVLPTGAVLGTMLIPLSEVLFHDQLTGVITGLLLVGAVAAAALLRQLRAHHTASSVTALNTGNELERRTAVEVLGDRGHAAARRHLIRRLTMTTETPEVKRLVLRALGRLQDEDAIPAILDRFSDPNLTVKVAAVEALAHFPDLGKRFESQAFTRYRIVSALKELFLREDSSRLKLAVMHVFASLRASEIIPFLLEVLRDGDPEVQADCISVIGSFRDPNIVHYLRPYLASENPRLKASAIIAMWQFEDQRLQLLVQLVAMLGRTDREGVLSTLYLLGELHARQESAYVLRHLDSDDHKARRHAAVALLKMDDERGVEALLPVILGADLMESWKARQMLQRAPADMRAALGQRLDQEISARINELLLPVRHDPARLGYTDLIELIRLYDLAEQHVEVARLRALLRMPSRLVTEAPRPVPAAA